MNKIAKVRRGLRKINVHTVKLMTLRKFWRGERVSPRHRHETVREERAGCWVWFLAHSSTKRLSVSLKPACFTGWERTKMCSESRSYISPSADVWGFPWLPGWGAGWLVRTCVSKAFEKRWRQLCLTRSRYLDQELFEYNSVLWTELLKYLKTHCFT